LFSRENGGALTCLPRRVEEARRTYGKRYVVSEMTAVEALAEDRSGVRSVRLRIPAKAEYIALARLALIGLAELSGMDEETLADLKLALTEAVSNSIRHAYAEAGGAVDIAYALGATDIEVEVVDDGAGFDPGRPPSLEGEELAEGGLGIAIIRTIVDELEIHSQPGVRGSRLRFVKRIREP
jgi:serine/threonine-protein kinase RsbW